VSHPTWLSARSPYRGQPRADTLQIRETPQARRQQRHTVLIHGYQNSEDRATESYQRFEEHVRRSPSGLASLGTLWHFHWPGNHRSKITSVRTYAARIDAAELSALLLVRDFLARLTRQQEVSLVAHSLGCRVALAAIAEIKREAGNWRGGRVRHVALLAAAVPQQLCLPPYKFPARSPGSTEHAYFSRKDRALGWAFDAGQREYGEFGEAVGKTGLPWGRWNEEIDMNIGHSEYWPSPAVATSVAGAIGQVGTPRRSRTRGAATSEVPPLPPPERKSATRESPARPSL
jgi:pimeloyl-ACP methyl ester carboxylesterase